MKLALRVLGRKGSVFDIVSCDIDDDGNDYNLIYANLNILEKCLKARRPFVIAQTVRRSSGSGTGFTQPRECK
jgi:hypothetical protein